MGKVNIVIVKVMKLKFDCRFINFIVKCGVLNCVVLFIVVMIRLSIVINSVLDICFVFVKVVMVESFMIINVKYFVEWNKSVIVESIGVKIIKRIVLMVLFVNDVIVVIVSVLFVLFLCVKG